MHIELQSLTKWYSRTPALAEVSLEIAPGQIVALLGPNGAGKTTLLRCLAAIAAPDAGEILFDGQPFRRDRLDLRKRLFFLPDFPIAYSEMSVLRHFGLVLRLYDADGRGVEERVIELLHEFDLLKIVAARMLLVLPLYAASFGLLVLTYRRDLEWQGQLVLIAAPFVAFFVALAGQGYLIGWRFNNAAKFGRLSSRNIWWFAAIWAGSPIGVFVAWQSMSGLFGYVLSTIPMAAGRGLWMAFPVVLLSGLSGGSFVVWLVAREAYRRSVADLAVTRARSFQLSTRTVDQGISVAHRRRALRRRYGWLWWLRKPGPRSIRPPATDYSAAVPQLSRDEPRL